MSLIGKIGKNPAGDEVIYLLSSSMDVILNVDAQSSTINLRTSGVVTIPHGVWYMVKVYSPCHALNISRALNR